MTISLTDREIELVLSACGHEKVPIKVTIEIDHQEFIKIIKEIDRHKADAGEVGFFAREASRILNDIHKQGKLIEGVPNKNGGATIICLEYRSGRG